MTSVVYFKFKNSITQEQITFDGSVIQIGDVKRLIALKRGLGAEGAVELTLFDSNTSDEYSDDSKVIPRNSLVLVKRAPATKLQPLQASAAPITHNRIVNNSIPVQPTVTTQQQPADDFGGDVFSDQPTAPVVASEEDAALQNLLAGTAATWQREVRQGAARGRGRGRGRTAGVPYDYRCPRCEAVGVHWLTDCPTHGNPEYDKRRVRPPVGIPMTRLARSTEGGLVLPDGGTGTLLANEDAFARELMGMGVVAPPPQQPATVLAAPDVIETSTIENGKEEEVLALPLTDEPSGMLEQASDQGLAEVQKQEIIASQEPQNIVVQSKETQKQGLEIDDIKVADNEFMTKYGHSEYLPRGPREFILQTFNVNKPMDKEEFIEIQDSWRARFRLPPLMPLRPPPRSPSRRSRSQSLSRRRTKSPAAEKTRERRRRSRSISRRRTKSPAAEKTRERRRRSRSISRRRTKSPAAEKTRERRRRSRSLSRRRTKSPAAEKTRERRRRSRSISRGRTKSPAAEKTRERRRRSRSISRRRTKSPAAEKTRERRRRSRSISRRTTKSPAAEKTRERRRRSPSPSVVNKVERKRSRERTPERKRHRREDSRDRKRRDRSREKSRDRRSRRRIDDRSRERSKKERRPDVDDRGQLDVKLSEAVIQNSASRSIDDDESKNNKREDKVLDSKQEHLEKEKKKAFMEDEIPIELDLGDDVAIASPREEKKEELIMAKDEKDSVKKRAQRPTKEKERSSRRRK